MISCARLCAAFSIVAQIAVKTAVCAHVLLCAAKQKQSDGCDKNLLETRLSALPEDGLISFWCCSLTGRL